MGTTNTHTPNVDYGKSTIFRFSIVNDKPPTLTQKLNDTEVVIKKPTSSQAMRQIGEDAPLRIEDIKSLNVDLFYFGEWLAENKSNIDLTTLGEKMIGVEQLSSSAESNVWGFLKTSVTTKNDFFIGKTINLLRANAMIAAKSKFDESEEMPQVDELLELLYEIANAPIVMPEELIPEFTPTKQKSVLRLDPTQQEMIKSRHHVAKQSYIIQVAEEIVDQIEKLEIHYQISKNKAYEEAYQKYLGNLPTPETPEGNEEPAPIEWPKFEFTYPSLNWEYASEENCFKNLKNIAEEIESALGQNKSKCWVNDVVKFKNHFEKKLDKARKSFTNTLPVTPFLSFEFNGSTIEKDNRPPDNTFLIQLTKLMPEHKRLSLVITHFTKKGTLQIDELDLSLSINSSLENNFGEFKKLFSSSEFESFVCFENKIELGAKTDEITLFGKFTTEDNKEEVPINVALRYEKLHVFTAQELQSADDMDGDSFLRLDAIPGVDDQVMHGIKRLGVLEYMKVDQELCCYVAGEVSHIENIMAREYKERVSKLMTRMETSTEETEEREEENTRDVSSTERYEMQSEIATMLSKERSMQLAINAGASATYSANPWTVNVNTGMNLNTSNSSSSSTNTSLAETVAKEVTQKATDRLLKKVSYKRTTKTLREQEDTLKHGFDNRSGANHVTGIYRWVDKIYKNSLYNYGKRLIYEFSIPEPSRNFKYLALEAEKSKKKRKKAEIMPPFHPKQMLGETDISKIKDLDLSFFKWTDIDRANYANLAAAYRQMLSLVLFIKLV